jgi:hypothetical protein
MRHKKTKIGCLISIIVIAALAIALAATCPDKLQHKRALSGVLSKAVQKEAAAFQGGKYATISGAMFNAGMVEKVFDRLFTYHNYVFFSACKYTLGDKDEFVSLGIMGHVFTPREEDVSKVIQKKKEEFRLIR